MLYVNITRIHFFKNNTNIKQTGAHLFSQTLDKCKLTIDRNYEIDPSVFIPKQALMKQVVKLVLKHVNMEFIHKIIFKTIT